MRLIFLQYLVPVFALAFVATAKAQGVDSVEISKAVANAKADAIFFSAVRAGMENNYKQERVQLEQFVATRPDVSAAWYELSRISLADKKIEKSEEYIKKAEKLNPDNKWYKEQHAAILAERGAFSEAAGIYAELSKAYPSDLNYMLFAAEFYERAKKYDEAMSFLDKAIVRNGEDEDMLVRKMQLYLTMNNVDKAAAVVQQLIDKDPKTGKYYKLLGELYDNNKLPAKATEVYNKAQKMVPNDPDIQLGLAEHYLKAGDSATYIDYVKKVMVNPQLDAESQLTFLGAYVQTLPNDSASRAQGLTIIRQIASQHPNDPQVIAFYGDFLEMNHVHDSAMMEYKKALALKPADFNLWRHLLSGYEDRKDADSLIRYSEKAMRLFPNQAVAHFYNGIGHFNKKEYPAAIKAINRAVDLQPENDRELLFGMYSILGDIYHAAGQNDLSDQSFEKAMKLNPNDPTLLNNYSYYLSERGIKLDEAEKMSKKSLDLSPNSGTFLDTYGWIQYKKGNYEKAREYIQKAIDLAGAKADGTLYDHLGNIFYKLNNKEKAVANWKIAAEKGADDPLINKKISEGKLYE